jgi:hypothetical protein
MTLFWSFLPTNWWIFTVQCVYFWTSLSLICNVGLSDVNMSCQTVWLLCTGQSYPYPSWVIVPSVLAASSASSQSECPSRSCACLCLEAASRSSGMWWDASVMYTHNILYQLCTLTTSCISYVQSQHPVSVMYTHNTLYQSCTLTTPSISYVHSQHPVSVMYTHNTLYHLCTHTTPCVSHVHWQHPLSFVYTHNTLYQLCTLTTSVSGMYTHNIHINLIEYFFQLSLKYWIECLVLLIHTQKIRVWFLVRVPFILTNFTFPFVCLFLSPTLHQGKFYNTTFRPQQSPLWSFRLMLCHVCSSKGGPDRTRKKVSGALLWSEVFCSCSIHLFPLYWAHCGACRSARNWKCQQARKGLFCSTICWTWAFHGVL